MRIVIAGASGLIGSALRERLLAAGDDVVSLVRRRPSAAGEVPWDPAAGAIDPAALEGADAVVNLSGASIASLPWTSARREAIERSRVDATRTLVDAIAAQDSPPALVSGSATGYYGSRPGVRLAEDAGAGRGFLAGVAERWEREALRAADSTRVALVRTGIVVHPDAVLKPLLALTRAGLSGPVGRGTQVWPWVSLDDEVRAIEFVLRDREIAGPVNVVGPTPASANDIGLALAMRLERPFLLRAPAFALRAALGDAAEDLLLVDQHIAPDVLRERGFVFEHDTAAEAIAAVVPGAPIRG